MCEESFSRILSNNIKWIDNHILLLNKVEIPHYVAFGRFLEHLEATVVSCGI